MSLSYRSTGRPSYSTGYGSSSSSSSLSHGRLGSVGSGLASRSFSGSSSSRFDSRGIGASSTVTPLGSSAVSSSWRSGISRTGLYPAASSSSASSSSSSFSTSRVVGGYVDSGLNRSSRDFTRGSLGTSFGSSDVGIARRRSSASSALLSSADSGTSAFNRGVRRHSARVESDQRENTRLQNAEEVNEDITQLKNESERRSNPKKLSSSFRQGRDAFRTEDRSSDFKTKDKSSERASLESTQNHASNSTGSSEQLKRTERAKVSLQHNTDQSQGPQSIEKPKRVQRTSFRERRQSQTSTASDIEGLQGSTRRPSESSCNSLSATNNLEQHEDTSGFASPSGVFDSKLASYVKDCDERSNIAKTIQRSAFKPSEDTRNEDANICQSKLAPNEKLIDPSPSKEDLTDRDKTEAVEDDITCRSTMPCNQSNVRDTTSMGTRKSLVPSAQDISKRPRANGTIGKSLSGTPNRGGTSSSASSSSCTSMAQQRAEIVRLESLCESRTKELTMAKIQYKDTTRAFDAMSVLFNYCSAELEAFKVQLADCMAQIGELNQDKSKLDSSLKQACLERDQQTERAGQAEALTEKGAQEHATLIKEMEGTHDAALTAQRDDLTKQHQEAARALHEQNNKHIERLKQYQERKMNDAKNESKMEISNLRIAHLEEIQELRNKHDAQMEELHKQHRNKLEDITHRFETIKLTLSEKVESLRGECEDLTKRAKTSEEALQRDADVKVQIAIAPFLNLPKEVESLKTVVEMRNEEIQRLRTKNMDLEKQLEEVPIGREKIISLQQKVENLEAIINIKTDHEKQLHEKCQVLMRKYDRESRANKTLSMENEQIMWRMSQSAEFGSSDSLTSLTTSITSLPGSLSGSAAGGSSKRHVSRTGAGSGDRLRQPRDAASPDMQGASPMSKSFHAGEEVQMRVKHNRASSGSGHRRSTGGSGRRGADWDNERQLRSRSATFVVEKGNGTDGGDGESSSGSADSHSLSSSPQAKPGSRRRGRQLSQGNSDWLNGDYDATISSNLSQSAGAVLHYELPSHASPRRGDGVTSHSPLVISAACTSTPRLDETFEDVSETTTANTTREDIVLQGEGGNTDNVMMMTSMGSSCTRSISSGVSDSGVYDSMTRSELLNSSMVSTDSEWGASSTFSNNASMTLDAALDLDDHDARSGPRTRDYNSLNDVTLVNNTCGSRSDTGSKDLTATNNSSFTIALHESPLVCDNSKVSRHQPLYTQQVSVPDDVFDEDMSMESCSFAAGGDNGHVLQGIDSLTSSVEVEEEVDEEEEEGCGFSVTCSDTVTDLAGVCSTKSPH